MLKKEVLRKKKDFSDLYKKGKSAGGKYVVLFYKKNKFEYVRHAFLASKKVGNSVKRNRARRLMRESFRVFNQNVKPGFDVLFIARNTIIDKKQKDVEKNIEKLLRRNNLLAE